MSASLEFTQLLSRVVRGEDQALDELIPIVYAELRGIARGQRGRLGGGETFNTTALVNEAFLKLAGGRKPKWNDRCHFFAVAATIMRQILVDHARRRGSRKRGGGWQRIDLADVQLSADDQAELILDLDNALEALARLNPRLTRVVECRYFAGLGNDETAVALGVTEKTVRRDWIKARAWLHRELGAAPTVSPDPEAAP